jgi:hypothetical protein
MPNIVSSLLLQIASPDFARRRQVFVEAYAYKFCGGYGHDRMCGKGLCIVLIAAHAGKEKSGSP